MSALVNILCYLLSLFNAILVSKTNSILIDTEIDTINCLMPKPSWIFFPYGVCIHLIIDNDAYPSICVVQLVDKLNTNGVPIYQKSLNYIQSRDISQERKTSCESFLILTHNPNDWIANINFTRKYQRIFYPFSRLYFLSSNLGENHFINVGKYLHEHSLFGYNFVYDTESDIIAIFDIVKNASMDINANSTDLSHPFVNINDTNKNFSASVYNCFPNVFYLNEDGSRKDGIEYRFVTNVLKNWNLTFLQQNESTVPFDPHTGMFSQIVEGTSELVMCGVWVHIMHYTNKDLATYFVADCNTFIAPKPQRIDSATLIYLTLSAAVWHLYAFCFMAFVVALKVISQVEGNVREKNIVTSNVGRCLLEAVATATSHGIENFPAELPVQITLISWIILNLLVGLGFTTIYTSRLTNPFYTKPIDTFEDFAENGLSWLSTRDHSSLLKEMNVSNHESFNQISKDYLLVSSQESFERLLKTRRFGFLMCIRTKHAYATEKLTDHHIWKIFRFLKTCYYSYYISFALPKHSPYTALFDVHIRRYQEAGIINHWYNELYRDQGWEHTLFDSRITKENEPKQLTLSNMAGAFVVLVTGLTIAFIAILLEILYYTLWRKVVV